MQNQSGQTTPPTIAVNPWIVFGAFLGAGVGANLFAVFFNFVITRIIFGPIVAADPGYQRNLDLNDVRVAIISGVAFPVITVLAMSYFWPLIRLGLLLKESETPEAAAIDPGLLERARRRSINAPLILSSLALMPWSAGAVVSVLLNSDGSLATQLSLLSLMSGAVATISAMLLSELALRLYLAPRLFPDGRLRAIPGALRLRLVTRMLLLAGAISILPVGYYHLLVYAGTFQARQGVAGGAIIENLFFYSSFIAPLFALLGVGLTLVLARSFSKPLQAMEHATERIEAGDYAAPVSVVSNDEIGVLGDSMNSMMAGLRDRAHILDQFGRLVDPRIRDYLLGDSQRLAGRRKEVVVFFSDIRSFTALSERISPEDVFALLNEHFTVLAGVIERCGGHVDKYIGDAVMAVFGLFDDRPVDHHCRQALEACTAIRAEVRQANAARAAAGRESIRIGMGLHVGEVLAGKLGSDDRFEYTVIGDTVNVASRIEALTKKFDTDLIVTDPVLTAVADTQATATHRVKVRGREEAITIHTL